MDAATTSVFDLSGKPLQMIISYLEMPEKLKLIVTDDRFVNILENTLADSIIDMSLIEEHFGVAETKDILSKCGHTIKRIRLEAWNNHSHDEYHQLVPIYCPNLEEIDLIGLEVTHSNAYAKLLAKSKRARILKMKKCIVSNGGCLAISKLSQLDTLDLENSKLTGNHFNCLKRLAHLSLKHCHDFKSQNLVLLFKATKLKTLNITPCGQLSAAAFNKLVDTQTDLQSVIVGNIVLKEGRKQICNLKNLRELSIRHCKKKAVVNYLKELVREHKDTFQSLDIHFGQCYPTESKDFIEPQIINRIIEFRNLTVLGLSCCSLLEDTHLLKVIKFCPDLEMIDIRASTFTDNAIIGCAENLDRLKFLDISYCNVRRRLYHLLVEIKQEKECREQFIVFIKHDTTLADWFKTECYEDYKHIVRLSLEPMRSYDNKGLLHRLADLRREKMNPPIDKIALKSNDISLATTSSLVNIDDNCLHHIMSFLNLTEKLQLVLSSNRFDNVFRQLMHFEVFDMPIILENFTIREVRIILQRFGSSIRKLHLRTASRHFPIEYHQLATKYCTNLNELHFRTVDIETVKEILVISAKNLSKVVFRYNTVDDEILQRISELKNLKVLCLEKTDTTGNHLGSLSQLIELDLMDCRNFKSDNFEAICKANKLRVLNIYGCMELDNNAFRTLIDTQTDLERLTLGKSYRTMIIENVAKLRNLIDLRLRILQVKDIQHHLESLIECRCDELQVLEIEYLLDCNVSRRMKENILKFRNLIYLSLTANTIVDNRFVKSLVKACPQLEIVNFSYCSSLSDEGIVTAIEKLKNLRHFDFNACKIDNALFTYQQILEIAKQRSVRPLTLYTPDILRAFAITKEYEATKKYLVLSEGCVSDLNLDKYRRERLISAKATRSLSPTQAENNYETTISPSIMDLSNSCLSHLMTYLDTTNQLKLALLHDRFYHLMQPWASNVIFDMSAISLCFTLSEAQQILSKFANHVKRIHFVTSIENHPLDYLNLIMPYILQLIEIEVNNCNKHFIEATRKLLASTEHLEIAKFKSWFADELLLPVLCKNKQLKVLEFNHSLLNGKCIHRFVNLVELNLEHCCNIQPWHLIQVFQNCQLKSLDIRHCYGLDGKDRDKVFDVLVETQIDLERLSISTQYPSKNLLKVFQLHNLKHLIIDNDGQKSEIQDILDELLRYRREDLLSLVLYISAANLTIDYCIYDVVQRRIKKFRNLQQVEIHQEPIYTKPYFSN